MKENSLTPEVTILMPVYNGEEFLKEAMDSILNQTFRNFQLLIINDGSTDNTAAILKTYNDPRIKIHHQENKGVSRSLNVGIAMIDTPFIRRHDADDISEPWMLQLQMDFLKSHPDIKLVSTMCAFMTNHGKVAHDFTQPKKSVFGNQEFIIANHKQFNPYCPIVHGTVLGPTAVFKEFEGYRTEFLTSEDNDLWLRIIEKYKFAVLKVCPYYLRLSPKSATKVHQSTTSFYRDLSYAYALERIEKGTDPLQRAETMENPKFQQIVTVKKNGHGKDYRNDLLSFTYKLMLNAKDYDNAWKIVKMALKDGWRLPQTWKSIFFPLFGEHIVSAGVSLKKVFK